MALIPHTRPDGIDSQQMVDLQLHAIVSLSASYVSPDFCRTHYMLQQMTAWLPI